MSYEFFAMPEEQISWLKEQWIDGDWWLCVRIVGRKDHYVVADSNHLSSVDFTDNNLVGFYLGSHSDSEPIWEVAGDRQLVDFRRSHAIAFDPSLLIDDRILTQGGIGIAARPWYEDLGIDFDPIHKRFQKLKRQLAKIMANEWMVVSPEDDGTLTEYRYLHLTPGAVSWKQEGGLLKPDSVNPISYEVVARTLLKKREG